MPGLYTAPRASAYQGPEPRAKVQGSHDKIHAGLEGKAEDAKIKSFEKFMAHMSVKYAPVYLKSRSNL